MAFQQNREQPDDPCKSKVFSAFQSNKVLSWLSGHCRCTDQRFLLPSISTAFFNNTFSIKLSLENFFYPAFTRCSYLVIQLNGLFPYTGDLLIWIFQLRVSPSERIQCSQDWELSPASQFLHLQSYGQIPLPCFTVTQNCLHIVYRQRESKKCPQAFHIFCILRTTQSITNQWFRSQANHHIPSAALNMLKCSNRFLEPPIFHLLQIGSGDVW